MGIAAYNRGSKAIADQIYPADPRPRPKPDSDPICCCGVALSRHNVMKDGHVFVERNDPPEGVLRSSFLPDSDTQVFLSYERGWYVIHTRFQTMKRKRNYDAAVKLFELVEMYGRYALTE